MLEVARADRPDDDPRVDVALARDRDLHLAGVMVGCQREVARHATAIELSRGKHLRQIPRRKSRAIPGAIRVGESMRERAEHAAVVGLRLDRALFHG